MKLPTPDQVNAATRHAISAAGGAIIMFGLSSKINIDSLTAVINSLGSIINNLVLIVGIVAPIVAGYYASKSASPVAQAAAVEKTGAVVIASPEIAAATPDSPNVLSNTEVKVISK